MEESKIIKEKKKEYFSELKDRDPLRAKLLSVHTLSKKEKQNSHMKAIM